MNWNRLAIITMLILLGIAPVNALCIIGIGSTCGDSSREESFFGRWIFNLNTPTDDDSFDILNIGKTIKNIFEPKEEQTSSEKPDYPTPSPVQNVGDKIKNTDLRGEEVVTDFTDISTVKVGSQDPWYYDLDIVAINGHQCIGCPSEYPNIGGFNYEFDIVLRNTGNVPADQSFTIEVIGEDLNSKTIFYNVVEHRPGFPVGAGDIRIPLYDMGYDSTLKKILPEFIYQGTGDDPQLPFKITVRLKDDDREVEPGFVEYVKKIRKCYKQAGGTTKCYTISKVIRETIHAKYNDPASDDMSIYYFEFDKITPTIAGDAQLNLN